MQTQIALVLAVAALGVSKRVREAASALITFQLTLRRSMPMAVLVSSLLIRNTPTVHAVSVATSKAQSSAAALVGPSALALRPQVSRLSL
jgi:hypothetical protein